MATKKTIEQHWKEAQDDFARLKACSRVHRDDLPMTFQGKGGVYVFFDKNGAALYVGRGRNVRQRILQHSRTSTKDAPFAWLLARDATKRYADCRADRSTRT